MPDQPGRGVAVVGASVLLAVFVGLLVEAVAGCLVPQFCTFDVLCIDVATLYVCSN